MTEKKRSFRVLLVAPLGDRLKGVVKCLEDAAACPLIRVESGAKALDLAGTWPLDLVVVDQELEDMDGLELARRLLGVNALINCAAVSDLDEEEFHERSEGLGILAQLDEKGSPEQAEALFEQLESIIGSLPQAG